MNRKGVEVIGENIVNIIIAAFVILVLLYLIYLLYGFFSSGNTKTQAESTLKEFVAVLQDLEKRERKTAQIFFQNPEGWFVAFPFSGHNKFIPPPSVCKDKCVCICEDEKCVKILSCQSVKYEIQDSNKLSAYFEIPKGGVEYNVELFNLDKKYVLTKK